MITDEYIKKYFTHKTNGNIMKSYLNKLDENSDIIQYLKNRYNDSESLNETLYRIFNNIEDKGKCPICGKPISFFSFKYGFLKTCSSKDCIKKNKNLNSCFHNPEKQLEIKQIIKEKYGVNNPYQIDYIKQKALLGTKSIKALNKRKQTCLEKYGVDNPSKTDKIKNKIRDIFYSKSNEEQKERINKISNTCLEKYGVRWYSNLPEYKENMSELMSSSECLNKRKNTSLKRYGIENYNNQELRIASLKKNKSWRKSKTEDETYILIKEKYPDVIRQYRSEKYPWACDFYIPSLDLYIEYNESQYHHKHPFDENNLDDIKELERLKQLEKEKLKIYKNTQYSEMIYTWTDLDIRKRNKVKENNLNFLELWNIKEVKDWLDKQ